MADVSYYVDNKKAQDEAKLYRIVNALSRRFVGEAMLYATPEAAEVAQTKFLIENELDPVEYDVYRVTVERVER